MTAYKGTVLIQGTLDNNPTDDRSYSTIETRVYNRVTSIDYVNFNGVYTYIRIVHIPPTGATTNTVDDPYYHGTLDKVLYRS